MFALDLLGIGSSHQDRTKYGQSRNYAEEVEIQDFPLKVHSVNISEWVCERLFGHQKIKEQILASVADASFLHLAIKHKKHYDDFIDGIKDHNLENIS